MKKSDIKNMKLGNSKIHKSCGITTLPTSVCKMQCKGCYARKAEKRFPAVLTARKQHLEATKQNNYISIMISEIKASGVKVFRIHESGDFYSQEYTNKWKSIMEALPEVKFYTYTKSSFIMPVLPNFNLIQSIVPGKGFNFGNQQYCEELQQEGYFLCPCIKGSSVECMKDCTVCATESKVCFLIH